MLCVCVHTCVHTQTRLHCVGAPGPILGNHVAVGSCPRMEQTYNCFTGVGYGVLWGVLNSHLPLEPPWALSILQTQNDLWSGCWAAVSKGLHNHEVSPSRLNSPT